MGKRLKLKEWGIDAIEWWILTNLTFYQDSCFFTFVKSERKMVVLIFCWGRAIRERMARLLL